MVRKSDMVRAFVGEKNYKPALRIAKGFRLGITKEQSDKMTLAYECMVHERTYRSLGYDIQAKINEGITVLIGLYGRSIDNAESIHQ